MFLSLDWSYYFIAYFSSSPIKSIGLTTLSRGLKSEGELRFGNHEELERVLFGNWSLRCIRRALGDIEWEVAGSRIMGEPLSPERIFDFLEDKLEPHPTYVLVFFTPHCYQAMVDEQMVVPAIEEVTEPVAEAEEEQVIALVIDMEEGQMDAPMMDIEEDLAALFGDDDFEDDASDGTSTGDSVLDGPRCRQMGAGLADRCTVERRADQAVANYSY
ncbi:hypothetical protein Tco_0009384 [Tanacetum coccineum]